MRWAAPLPTPSQDPARPRAPRRRLYGLRAGLRCQSAARGRAPGSPLRGGDTTPAAPSPLRLPAGPSPARPAPGGRCRGGAGGGQGGCGRPPGSRGERRGVSLRCAGGRAPQGPREAVPGPAAEQERGRDPAVGRSQPGSRVREARPRPLRPARLCRGHLSLGSAVLLLPARQNTAFSRAQFSHF